MCVHVRMCLNTQVSVDVLAHKDLWKIVLSFHCVGPGSQTQVTLDSVAASFCIRWAMLLDPELSF